MAASIRKAPSLEYYTGEEFGKDPERSLLADKTGLDGKPTYYERFATDDPLKAQAVWAGKLAHALGSARGSAVSKQGLAAAWYAIDPRDGVSSLLKDGPSVAEQIRAQQRIARAEGALFGA